MQRINRRRVLKLSGAGALAVASGGLAGILASGRAPAFDALLKGKIKEDCQKALGINLEVETINGDGIHARITSAIQAKTGPDILMAVNNWAQLDLSLGATASPIFFAHSPKSSAAENRVVSA